MTSSAALQAVSAVLVTIAFGVLSAPPVAATSFLGPQANVAGGFAKSSMAEQSAILAELETALSNSNSRTTTTDERLERFVQLLKPTFTALPKNSEGLIGGPAARYALHRLFVQQHAWQVKGLEPSGDAWDGMTPLEAFADRAPEVQSLFERRFESRGLNLHELAALAVTFEHLVHVEAMQRLNYTFRALEFPDKAVVGLQQAHRVLDTYMASYILGFNFTELTPAQVRKHEKIILKQYEAWPETQKWMRDVLQESMAGATKFNFGNLETVVETAGERYGRWQSGECSALKDKLVAMEDRNATGRVRLADFYSSAVYGDNWQFCESSEYLQQLGALDDSDPSQLKVIIPNYINSLSNCVASSSYYAVCCIDECEDLMGSLESKLGTAEATPADILSAISQLPAPGSNNAASREVPAALVRKLKEVAEHNGGSVPLHGRLFQQWLHHVYPRECQYPHVSGTISPRRVDAWQEETGKKITATKEEMRQFIEAARSSARSKVNYEEGMCSAMWTMEEELVAKHVGPSTAPTESADPKMWRTVVRSLALIAAALSLVGVMFGVAAPAFETACGDVKGKGFASFGSMADRMDASTKVHYV